MSSLDLVPVQDAISAYVREQFPNYEVYDDDVIDDDFVLKQGNKVKPYVVLVWGGLRRSGNGASFAGVRSDEYYSTVDVDIIAPTPRQARRANSIIIDKLIGWKPTGGGAMTPEGGTDRWAILDANGRPHAYASSTRLRYAMNSENAGAYITP